MNKSLFLRKCTFLVFFLNAAIAFMPSFAGSPGPPFSESEGLEYVRMLKAAKEEVMPGDNAPRRVRLAGALYSMANFYNSNKSHGKADQYYAELFALMEEDDSERRLHDLRYYSEAAARDYMQRGDLEKSKGYIDMAVKICREDASQKAVLPSVLTTLASWQRQMKFMKEAESTLLEAIGLLGIYGYSQRGELAQIYLETNQLAKADQTISEMEKSTYEGSANMYLRALWLRAVDRSDEADKLETKARAKEAEEIEHRIDSQ